MQPVLYDPATGDPPPAFAGMLADNGFTDKLTVACGPSPQPFGTVVGTNPTTGRSVLPVGTNPIGVALHDHNVGGRAEGGDGYTQYDRMGVIQRGRVWGLANGACTIGAPAKYDPATGAFSDAGTATFPKARFLSATITVPGFGAGALAAQAVMVELHNPTA